jgi:prephenate dehydrogenase
MAMFEKMVVAGVGLIGGSLALDMRRLGLVKEIVGYGRSEGNLRIATRKGIIDRFFLREPDIPSGVDLLLIGTPRQYRATTAAFLPRLTAVSLAMSAVAEIVKE